MAAKGRRENGQLLSCVSNNVALYEEKAGEDQPEDL